jgi:YgiT-type zinc finger domain-containing protein
MKCVICKTGTTIPSTVTLTLERDNITIIFKRVPALVCGNCDEEYVNEETVDKLLQEVEQAAGTGIELEVRTFTAA